MVFERGHLTGKSFTKTCSEAEEKSEFIIRTLHRRADIVPNSTEAKDECRHLREALKACNYLKWIFVNTEARAFRKSSPSQWRFDVKSSHT